MVFTIALMGVVLIAGTRFYIALENQRLRVTTRIELQTELNWMIDKIRQDVYGAQSVTLPLVNGSGGALEFINGDGDTIMYTSNAGAITKSVNGNVQTITDTGVTVSALSFTYYETRSNRDYIDVTITAEHVLQDLVVSPYEETITFTIDLHE